MRAAQIQDEILRILGRALAIRQVDAGSCNGCELEIHALSNPYYNIEGLGIRFVASPRHADLLLVTGPVSKHMAIALRRTYEATPDPKLVVAVGDCGCAGGIFGESYATLGASRMSFRWTSRSPAVRRRHARCWRESWPQSRRVLHPSLPTSGIRLRRHRRARSATLPRRAAGLASRTPRGR